jgi:hypothetical protein
MPQQTASRAAGCGMKRSGSQFQCLSCFQHFAGPHSFARHRADLECLSADAMHAVGMTLTSAEFWTISRTARSDDPISTLTETAT